MPCTPPALRWKKALSRAAARRCFYATKALEGLKGQPTTTRPAVWTSSASALFARRCARLLQNAGHDGAVVSGKLLEGNDPTMGFNAQTDTYENLVQAGVIDPTKVVRTALQNAASVAGLLITTEAAVFGNARRQAGDADGRRRHGRHGRNGLLTEFGRG